MFYLYLDSLIALFWQKSPQLLYSVVYVVPPSSFNLYKRNSQYMKNVLYKTHFDCDYPFSVCLSAEL